MVVTRKNIWQFALISVVFLLVGLIVLWVIIWKAPLLTKFGLTGYFVFVAYVLLGLCVAGVLFGVLKSYAVYHSKQWGLTVDLSGPVVGFLLTIVLGILFNKNDNPVALTVFVHGPGGHQDIVVHEGRVLID